MNTTKKLITLLLVMLASLMCSIGAEAQEAYAVFTEADSTLTFFYDELRSTHSGTTYDMNTGANTPDWFVNRYNVSQVRFDSSFAAARPTSTCLWFGEMINLQSVTGLEYLNTSDVTDMAGMFTNCSVLKSLDLSGFNTSNVRNMERMFLACRLLTTLDLSSFNTSNVTRMNQMFSNCGSLVSLDLSSFNTSNVTNMGGMFHSCKSLIALDLSGFNTSNVTDMGGMFYSCNHLETIYASNSWSTVALTYSDYMFYGCANLVGGQGTVYYENYVDATYAHIDKGPSNPGYFTGKGKLIPGDVNGDGEVNIADVNAVIDVILGGNYNSAADVNNDREINIADVNTIIDIILGSPAPTPSGIETITVNGVSFNMITVEGGTFTMGATDEQGTDLHESVPVHQVTLSSYSIGETEVTQTLWQAVMGSNPSFFTSDLNNPVEQVSWDDCQEFITKLNQLTGKTFRLPTEAEWEYAARGGNKSKGYVYSGSNNPDDVAWYWYSIPYNPETGTRFGSQPVGTKVSNELGIYDMSGNVEEWVYDWYGNYSDDAQINPTGPESGSEHVTRGGGFYDGAPACRVASRGSVEPSYSNFDLGLRLVIGAEVEEEHEWVDLGLPSGTLWATCNVGANAPEEYGDYFAWGETSPKDSYEWSNYKWGNYYVQGGFSKYVTDSEYGTVDYKTELEPEDDAASVYWGPSWCMPSREQQSELFTECSWEWTSMNDVNGYLVTGPNGNTLFLPAAGCYEGSSLISEGGNSEYWSRSLRINLALYSHTIYFYGGDYGGNVSLFEFTRERGLSVRAVRVSSDDLYIEQQSLDLGVVPVGETCTGELTIVNCTNKPMTLTMTADAPFTFNQEEGSASSITVMVPGNTRDTMAVMFTATTPGEFNGNVTIQNAGFDGGQRVIPVHARAFTDDFPQHEWVDMGLPSGTLWATCNIGANSPEEYGDYFAWGEISPQEAYTWETYKWCDGTSTSMTKYCLDSYYGLVDHKFELEPADDAAYMNWGPSWRMPTREQLFELGQYCTWQSTSINGINGYLVTGPNGNTLFFPRAGMYDGSSDNYAGYFSFYWSRTLKGTISSNACCTYSMSPNYNRNRYNGLPVRAVRVQQ